MPREDAQARVEEVRSVIQALWADRDDPHVLSQLVALMRDLRHAEDLVKVL